MSNIAFLIYGISIAGLTLVLALMEFNILASAFFMFNMVGYFVLKTYSKLTLSTGRGE